MMWNRSYLSLAVVLLFLGTAVQPAVAGPDLNDFPDETDARDGRELSAPFKELSALVAELKASTTDPTDSDGDGLPDSVEWVIGTDPQNNDTDFDRLNDSREIQLQLDPNEIDSNRDGLADCFEVNNVPPDLDGDGVDNAWDWDNDNDGVVDSIDLSPFAKTNMNGSISLSINSSGKPTYVQFQLRTKNPNNMRLLEQVWDWPDDNRSTMQDLDQSTEDVTVTPMLVFKTDLELDPLAVAEYGIFVDGQTVYLPLVPVTDYGNIVAFNAMMFIPGIGGPAQISGSMYLNWMVTGYSDREVRGLHARNGNYVSVNQTGVVRANASELTEREGLEFVDSGPWNLTLKAANGMYLKVGSGAAVVASAVEIDSSSVFIVEAVGNGIVLRSASTMKYISIGQSDGELLADATAKADAAIFDLTTPWIQPYSVTLAVYPEDFMLTGLSVEENFGSDFGAFYGGDVANLTAANLLLAYDFLRNGTNRVANMSGLLASHNISVQSKTALFAHRDLALVATSGKGLRDMIDTLPDHEILPIINIIEDRSAVVDLSELDGASYMKGTSLGANVGAQPVVTTKTLKTNWYDTDNDTNVDILEVMREIAGYGLSEDSLALLLVLSLIWDTGEITVTNVGGEQIAFQMSDRDTIIETASNTASDGLDTIGTAIGAITATTKGAKAMKITRNVKNIMESLDNVKSLNSAFKKIDCAAAGVAKWGKKIATALDVIGWAVDVSVAAITFFMMVRESGLTAEGVGTALMMASLMLVYSFIVGFIADMLLACIPGWGILLAGIFLAAVWLAEKYGGTDNWLKKQIGNLAKLMTRQIPLSEADIEIVSDKLTIDDKDGNGLDVGDKITYNCVSNGTITALDHWKNPKKRQWVTWEAKVRDWSWTDVTLGLNTGGTRSTDYDDSVPKDIIDGSKKISTFNQTVSYVPNGPSVNVPFTVNLSFSARTYYRSCFWWPVLFLGGVWVCTRESTKTEYPKTTIVETYFDVMPGTIDQFAAWKSIKSDDPDGDGLNDTSETSTNRSLWDTDADGLGDSFELLIGTCATKADSDADGLNDKLEIELGTCATSRDSDEDGLDDGTEHRGWVICFNYNGKDFYWHVAPDPRFNDTDGDGLDDYTERACLFNPMSSDTDGDGTPDGYKEECITTMEFNNKFGEDSIEGWDIAVDEDGYIYATSAGGYIRKFDRNGIFVKNLGEGTLTLPTGVEIDAEGYLWVADYSGYGVFKLDRTTGTVQMSIFDKVGNATLMVPIDVAVDNDGYIYIVDQNENGVLKYDKNGTFLISWGRYGTADGQFMTPYAIDTDSKGRVYVGELQSRVQAFDSYGTFLKKWTAGTYPLWLNIDSNDYLIVSECGPKKIEKFDYSGKLLASISKDQVGNALFLNPRGVTSFEDRIYVLDAWSAVNCTIVELYHNVTIIPAIMTAEFTDADGDGLTDAFEEAGWEITGTNLSGKFNYNVTSDPLLYDTDGDGLSDKAERNLGTDPRKADTDGDGLSDREEAGPSGRAIQGRAVDGYGYGGRAGMGTNAANWDTDGDGLGDGVELNFKSDPTNNDTDGDGLPDNEEFRLGADPQGNDTDYDGLDDFAETAFGSDILTPDADDDLLYDGSEFELGTDPNSNDTDRDGLIDGYETIYGTDPKDPDTDDDGLPDGFEIENMLNASCNDTDGDNVSDAEELVRGLNPFSADSDGDWIPDELDLDYSLVLDDEVVLVMDPDVLSGDFAAVLSEEVNVVEATPAELLASHKSAPYIVIVGRPDADNGTAGAVVRDLLEDTGEVYDAMLSGEEHLAVRYGVWSPTQTVVMLSTVGDYDALMTLSLLKSMKMTVTKDSITAEYLNPRSCFVQNFMETALATDSSVYSMLDAMATFNVTISKYGRQNTPVTLEAGKGLEPGEVAMGKYLEVRPSDNIWSEGVDLITGGEVNILYTAADLDRTGDGDADDPEDINESTLAIYWYNETAGSWSKLPEGNDWENGSEHNTTDFSLFGREYAGILWAGVDHFSLFGIGGRMNGGMAVQARAGGDQEVLVGEEVFLNGSLSSGGWPILNFTWSFQHANETVRLYGPQASFVFQQPGTYVVTLTVTDSLGLTASDTLTVTVRERAGGLWTLRVGPVRADNGTALEGALVNLTIGSESLSNITNAQGIALFELGAGHVGKGVGLFISKEGYLPAEYGTNITSERVLERDPPPLVKIKPGEEFTLGVGPVADKNGNAIEGAKITITVGDKTYTNYTDSSGVARFALPLTLVGKAIGVTIEKNGFRTVSYGTRISSDRKLDQNPPAMEKAVKPAGGGDGGIPAWILGAVALVAILLILLGALAMRRKPPAAAKDENEAAEKKSDAEEKTKEGPPPVPPIEGPDAGLAEIATPESVPQEPVGGMRRTGGLTP